MKKTVSIILCFSLLILFSANCFSLSSQIVKEDTAAYLYGAVSNPQVGSVGGEWAILGLARSGVEINEEYFEKYYENVERYVAAKDGVLHNRKYTEYSRVIIALTAIGKDPTNVAGYNLLVPLGDYEKTVWQGVNGAIWALVAINCGEYEIPQNNEAKVQATEELYINHILEAQKADGGWAMSGDTSDPDLTAMALTALSKYQDTNKVKAATQKALLCMSQIQDENGGFSGKNGDSAESCAQMLVALCELGIPVDCEAFVKNGNSIYDNLIDKYYVKGQGFKNKQSAAETNQMSTEQSFYGVVALNRAEQGKSGLYTMDDVDFDLKNEIEFGLIGKNPEVKKAEIVNENKTFEDIKGHKNQSAIENLARRNIINGKTSEKFEPDATMTRAEFATIIVKGLGFGAKGGKVFEDVCENDWFYQYVNTAYAYGIVNGVSSSNFNPDGTITREEAGVMLSRAAKLCGASKEMNELEIRNTLAVFSDYVKVSEWAKKALAFCCLEGIISDEETELEPKRAVKRCEIAQMLFNMLDRTKLI